MFRCSTLLARKVAEAASPPRRALPLKASTARFVVPEDLLAALVPPLPPMKRQTPTSTSTSQTPRRASSAPKARKDRKTTLATSRTPSPTTARKKNTSTALTVGDFPPFSAQWSEQRNRLRKPDHAPLNSTWKIKWHCDSCGADYSQRIRDYVDARGACPECAAQPHLNRAQLRLLAPGSSRSAGGKIVGLDEAEEEKADAKAREKKKAVSIPRKLNPELAHRWEKFEAVITDTEPLYVSPKLDGIRCIVYNSATPKDLIPKPTFVSRQGVTLESCDHLLLAFEELFLADPTAVFDGELYTHHLKDDFEEITGAVRVSRARRTPEHEEVQNSLKYHVFDMMHGEGLDETTPFSSRNIRLRKLFQDARPGSKVTLVSQRKIRKAAVQEYFKKALSDGYEGLMVRVGDSHYAFGKRTSKILKVKEFQDSEFKIVGFEEGDGSSPTSQQFKATPKCSESKKKQMWKDREKYRGKMLTVTYQLMTKHGIPRFPIAKAVRGLPDGRDWL